MFLTEKLLKYRYAHYMSNIKPYATNYFVFSEDQNDIITIHGISYESADYPFESASGQKLKVLGSRGRGFPQIAFLRHLAYMIGFQPSTVVTNANIFVEVFVGRADLILEKVINLPSTTSLMPTMRVADNLWILDMPLKGSPTYFLELFELKLWLAYFVTFMCIGVLSTLGIYALRRYSRTNSINHFNWFSIFVNQGADEPNEFISRNVLILSLSLLTIIFHGSFEAFISSSQAIRYPDVPFNDLDGLIRTDDFTICVQTLSPGYKYINANRNNSALIKTRINNANCPGAFSYDAGVTNSQLVRIQGCPLNKTAVLISDSNFRFNGSKQLCNFTPLHGDYFVRYFSIMAAPGWKYREQFNQKLILLRTSGILSKFVSGVKFYKEIQEPNGTVVQMDEISIDAKQTVILFGLFLFGIVFSIAVLGCEVLIKKYF